MDEARIKAGAAKLFRVHGTGIPGDDGTPHGSQYIQGPTVEEVVAFVRTAIAEATAEARRCPCGTLQENVRCKACMAVMTERAVAEVASEWAETLNATLSAENERLKAEIKTLTAENARLTHSQAAWTALRRKVKNFRKDIAQYKRQHDANEWFRRSEELRVVVAECIKVHEMLEEANDRIAALTAEVAKLRQMRADEFAASRTANEKLREALSAALAREQQQKEVVERWCSRVEVAEAEAKRLADYGETWLEEYRKTHNLWVGAEADAARLRLVLARLEWINADGFECPACCGHRDVDGHTPDCWIAAALSQANVGNIGCDAEQATKEEIDAH